MKILDTNEADLLAALAYVNEKFGGNIVFRTGYRNLFTPSGVPLPTNKKRTTFDVRLTVKDSRLAGSRRSNIGRRISSACWHVNGHFFDYLLSRGAKIRSAGGSYNSPSENWQDKCGLSRLCNCTNKARPEPEHKIQTGTIHDDGSVTEARAIPQAQLSAECWEIQFRGVKACEQCPALGSLDCGGKNIRKTGKNEKGFTVPLGQEVVK